MKSIKYKIIDTGRIDKLLRGRFVNPLIELMSQKPFEYEFIETDSPDYVFCCEFANDKFSYDCIRILIGSEAHSLDFNTYDYALGYEDLQYGDRYCKHMSIYPVYGPGKDLAKLLECRERRLTNLQKSEFCSFIYSNSSCFDRNRFFIMLSKYKKVISAGRYNNNLGQYFHLDHEHTGQYNYEDNISILSRCKFNISFENYPNINGYVTEKIMIPFIANCVPIYYGAYNVADYYNPKAFINCHEFDSFEKAIEHVIEVDNNDDMYYDIFNQPIFTQAQLCYHNNHNKDIQTFFNNIFSQDIKDAFRRPRFDYLRKHEKYLTEHKMLLDESGLDFAHEKMFRLLCNSQHMIRLINLTNVSQVLAMRYMQLGYSRIMYYGLGETTKYIIRNCTTENYSIVGIIDNGPDKITPMTITIVENEYILYSPFDLVCLDATSIDAIIITVTEDFEEIKRFLLTANSGLNIISLEDVLASESDK